DKPHTFAPDDPQQYFAFLQNPAPHKGDTFFTDAHDASPSSSSSSSSSTAAAAADAEWAQQTAQPEAPPPEEGDTLFASDSDHEGDRVVRVLGADADQWMED
ncbi:hypothetical protein ETH_00034005, partial [Eimeria tenella]